MRQRLVIIHDESESYLGDIESRFPELDVFVCAGQDQAAAALEFRPDIVFSWKGKAIPADVQKNIISSPSVKWVHIAGAGVEHLLPVPGNIRFTNSSGVCSDYMAETVMGAILMWNFEFPRCFELKQERKWQQYEWTSLNEKSVLVIGLGKIGLAVARQARNFGMRVLGVRTRPGVADFVDHVYTAGQLHEALLHADYVCLHVPLTTSTRHMFGQFEFVLMKRDSILINTSRGGVVDERALSNALSRSQIRGAYMDVFEHEPLPADSPLWAIPNLIISPHISDSAQGWQRRFAEFFMLNLAHWLNDEPLLNTIDVSKGY